MENIEKAERRKRKVRASIPKKDKIEELKALIRMGLYHKDLRTYSLHLAAVKT